MAIKLKAGSYYRARNGALYGPLMESGGEKYPFTALPSGTWTGTGSYLVDEESHLDLIAEVIVTDAPEPIEHVRYVNFYKDRGDIHNSRSTADNFSEMDRLACIRIVLTEGQFDD